MSEFAMMIDGRSVGSVSSVPVIDPATASEVARVPDCTRQQLDEAVAAAEHAADDWDALGPDGRQPVLERIADELDAHAAELARLVTAEMGRPLHQTVDGVRMAAEYFRYYAALRVVDQWLRDTPELRVRSIRRPVGPVAAITPWNSPVILLAAKVAPALAAGNPVILKPSPASPLSALWFGAVARDLLPAGVLSVLSGGTDLGRWLSDHPGIRHISFTGSVQTGRRVARAAAKDFKRVTLELGGNDPAVLLDDIDPTAVAERLVGVAFVNAGQVCIAPKRVYVPRSRYAEVVDAMTERIHAITVGNGLEHVQMGPVANRSQYEFVTRIVEDTVAAGARLVTGGPMQGNGFFYAPALIADATHGMRLVDEEQFGPALPLIAYDDEAEALAHANMTGYGLGSSVWSGDPERAVKRAAQLEAGLVWVNTHVASLGVEQPYGGLKSSGLGLEGGVAGYLAFTEHQLRYEVRDGYGPGMGL